MTTTKVKHPAKYSDSILEVLRDVTSGVHGVVLDGMAGTGKIHQLQRRGMATIGNELEPEWANLHPQTVVGNALCLPFADNTFNAYVTSPCYGNRMADAHNARDESHRNTYTHVLGRKLHPDNSGTLQWGPEYRHFHLRAWMEAWRVLKTGSKKTRMIVNVSNHIRKDVEIDVTGWHAQALEAVGFIPLDVRTVETPRNRDGQNGDVRCEYESVLVFGTR